MEDGRPARPPLFFKTCSSKLWLRYRTLLCTPAVSIATYNPRRIGPDRRVRASAMKTSAAGPRVESAPVVWVYNPWLDLIVGCGAWSAPLLLLAYYASGSSELGW